MPMRRRKKNPKLGNKLATWDFTDPINDTKSSLVNRQKSARNLDIEIDAEGIATCSDQECCTLHDCTCYDFSTIGGNDRKKFQPCMHIYRLAFELGLLEAKYKDLYTRIQEMSQDEKAHYNARKIRQLPKDPAAWGSWNPDVHTFPEQKNRQLRAFETRRENECIFDFDNKTAKIWMYDVSLAECTCADFVTREVPCKHIYCLAFAMGIKTEVTQELYDQLKAEHPFFECYFTCPR